MPFDSPMTAIRGLLQRARFQIADTEAVDNPSGTKAIGQFQFLPSFYGETGTYRFEAVLSVSNALITGSVQLYNVTDGEAVTNGLLQTTSTTPTQVISSPLTVGSAAGNLKDTTKIYEVRISVTGALASDILSVGSVLLRVA
jgi:hypothetical protein